MSAPVLVLPASSVDVPPADGRWDPDSVLGVLQPTVPGTEVVVSTGWDLAVQRGAAQRAATSGRSVLPVRVLPDEVLVGPLHDLPGPTATHGCAGCAEVRERVVAGHPLTQDLQVPRRRPAPRLPVQLELLRHATAGLVRRPLAPGEMLVVGRSGVRRHRVVRHPECPVCVDREALVQTVPVAPEPLHLGSEPTDPADASRGLAGRRLLSPGWLTSRTVDERVGPVAGVVRESRAPFAMSMAHLPDSIAMGYGRARTFGRAEPTAVLEAYERLAGFPHEAPVVQAVPYRELADLAVDPAGFGGYTAEQLAAPGARVTGHDPDRPEDWVWGHDLRDGRARLVPAEIGFYQYDHGYRRERLAARRAGAAPRRHVFHESSSGCALGGSLVEAALHSMLELAERDAFLLAWHRGAPLPEIDPRTVTDPLTRRLSELVRDRGYDVHLLVATQDVAVPVVWALAARPDGGFPAAFSAAGSGLDGATAARAAMWELTQIVTEPVAWDRAAAERLQADPWLITTLEDHMRVNALPERLPRVQTVLGGPVVLLEDAFGDLTAQHHRAAGGDLYRALQHVRGRFADAGLGEHVLVDQTTRAHRAVGVAVAKVAVPGITPMCFGHAHQRLLGLDRVQRAALAGPAATSGAPFDPHPFP